jgi:hypothetical protein
MFAERGFITLHSYIIINFLNHIKMNYYKKTFRNVLIALIGITLIASCGKEDETPKSAACDIINFNVAGTAWDIDDNMTFTHNYPPETQETELTPTISLSPGATVNPPTGEAKNFFTASGVTYTVTAADGVTTKVYTAKATRTRYSAPNILSFAVDGTDWQIGEDTISYTYEATISEDTIFTPTITLSPGATIDPPANEENNFFTASGVRYTVTAEDGTTKVYIAKAYRTKLRDCDILSFGVGDAVWNINDIEMLITYEYPPETPVTERTPTIELSQGATINPPASEAKDFFTGSGVTYTVTAEDGTTKIYTAKATIQLIGGATGDCTWELSGLPGDYTLTIRGNGEMEDYSAASSVPWRQYGEQITAFVIENGVTRIGDFAFAGSTSVPLYVGVSSLEIPNSVISIGQQAFIYCDGLTSVVIGNSVTTIGDWAFYYCSGMTSLTIGYSATNMGYSAFDYCTSLVEVINLNPVPQDMTDCFFGAVWTSLAVLKVPTGSGDAYRATPVWDAFGIIEEF